MVALTAAQERNLRAALATTDNRDEQLRLAFAIWTESRAVNYANNGTNSSRSPGFDKHPEWPAILRRSMEIPHDDVGSNGRSTGILQQTSQEVAGGWGSMVGTMDPATSARRFLDRLTVTNDRLYVGTLLTPTGSMRMTLTLADPIAADVLRVQQPLADEAASSNYGAAQVAIAREIVAQLAVETEPSNDWMTVATKDEVREAFSEANAAVVQQLVAANQQLGALNQRLQAMVDYQHGILEQQNAMNVRLDALVKNTAKE